MDQREKLIELLLNNPKAKGECYITVCDTDCKYWESDNCYTEMLADHLLANGVVVLPCRCGECKHFYKYNCHSDNMRMNMCKLAVGTDGEDFFCPYGERKGGE